MTDKNSNKKIDTVVFDLGKVLVHFHPEQGIREIGFSEEAIKVFMDVIFPNLWEECDRIPYEDAEIRALFKEAVPGFEREVDMLWDNLHPVTGVRPYANDWLKSLKDRGYRLLVLSNFGKRGFEINSQIYDFLKYMDGGIISYQVQVVKPEPEIYDALIEKYSLDPSTCVFIDDRKINVDAGIAKGFKGILFESYEQASKELESLLEE